MYAWIGKKRRGAQISEDELTSCVFGPLRAMQPAQAWKSCLVLLGLDDWSPCPEPSRVDVRFWPRFQRDEGWYVEPDLHVVAWGGGKVVATVLVEVKWDNTLGENQLIDQWKWISVDDQRREDLRKCSRHVLLSDRSLRYAEQIDEQRARQQDEPKWGDRLAQVSWHDVARNLNSKMSELGESEMWSNDLLRFLASQGIMAFYGFDRLSDAGIGLVEWRFDGSVEYRKPALHATGHLGWSFSEKGALA